MVVCSSAMRAKGCSKPCSKWSSDPTQIPSPHCRGLPPLPVTPVWMQQPLHHHTGPLIALHLQEGRAHWYSTGQATAPWSSPKAAGWGRQDSLYKDRGTQGSFLLEWRNGILLSSPECFPGPKTAYPIIAETSSQVPGHPAFPSR